MHTTRFVSLKRMFVATLVAAALVTLTACGPSVTGTYNGVPGRSVFQKIELKSGGKAVVSFGGETHEVTYTVKGKSVFMTDEGQTNEFKIDDKGCLNDPMGGQYCKG